MQQCCATSWAKMTENVACITWPLVARLIFNSELNQHGYQGRISSKLISTLNCPPDPWMVDHTTLLFSNNDKGCKGIVSWHLTSVRSRFNDHGAKRNDGLWSLHSRPQSHLICNVTKWNDGLWGRKWDVASAHTVFSARESGTPPYVTPRVVTFNLLTEALHRSRWTRCLAWEHGGLFFSFFRPPLNSHKNKTKTHDQDQQVSRSQTLVSVDLFFPGDSIPF